MTPLLIMILLGAAALALSGLWIWVYRHAAAKYQAEATLQRRLAEVSETRVNHLQARNASLQQLQQKHRKETIDETKPQHLAARNDLDNDGSDRLPGAITGASHSGATDAADTAGSSGD